MPEQIPKIQWLVIDSLDRLELLIHQKVATDAGKEHVSQVPYGQGYKEAAGLLNFLLAGLDKLREEKGIGVILIAHSQSKRFESPEHDTYDRYCPKLHDAASSLAQEWADEVFFAGYKILTRAEDQGFNRSRNIALGTGERYIRTTETAAVIAKNRLSLPAELPMDWAEYEKFFSQTTATKKKGSK